MYKNTRRIHRAKTSYAKAFLLNANMCVLCVCVSVLHNLSLFTLFTLHLTYFKWLKNTYNILQTMSPLARSNKMHCTRLVFYYSTPMSVPVWINKISLYDASSTHYNFHVKPFTRVELHTKPFQTPWIP